MKITFLILLFFLQISSNLQAQEIEIRASRLHGLVVFVFSNANLRSYSPAIKEYTDKSEYSEALKKIIGNFSNLEMSLRQGSSYREEGKDYGDAFTVQDILEIQSAHAKDVDDLMTRLQGTLPLEDWLALHKILKSAEPIYEKLIWRPFNRDLAAMESVFQKKAREWKMQELFQKAQIFYNADWPKDLKFTIALYPIPPGAKHSNAHSLANFESVGVIIGEKNIADRMGVAFHEMMHSLYAAQNFAFKNKLYSFYQTNKKDPDLAYREGAQRYSNEIFATLLGNGWFVEMASGQVDQTDWYNNKYINGTAKAMYDLTKSYLHAGKSLDEKYILTMISQFKELFPNYPEEAAYLFKSVEIQHSGLIFKSMDLRSAIRSKLQIGSLGISGDSELLKNPFRLNPEGTTLILLAPQELTQLNQKYLKKIEMPAALWNQIKKSEFGLYKWTTRNMQTCVIGISSPEKITELFSSVIIK